jgi:hypothetical protein
MGDNTSTEKMTEYFIFLLACIGLTLSRLADILSTNLSTTHGSV